MTSICDPMPAALAAELSGRDDAGSVLDRLEHETSLVTATGPRREVYRVQELLRTYLVADLQRHGVRRVAGLHAVTARWWAAQDQPLPALEHATRSRDERAAHRPAAPLRPPADPGRGPRAAAARAGRCRCAGHRGRSLAVSGLRAHPPRGGRAFRRAGRPAPRTAVLACARRRGPRGAARRRRAVRCRPDRPHRRSPSRTPTSCPPQPELEALARLSRGHAHLEHDDRAGARAEFGAALALSRRHGFDYLTMQCLALLGVVAGLCGELRTMRTVSDEALAIAADHGWRGFAAGRQAAAAMIGLLRPAAATCPPTPSAAPPMPWPRGPAAAASPDVAVRPARGARGRRVRPGRPGRRAGRAATGTLGLRRQPDQPATLRRDGDAGVPRRAAARARRSGTHRPGLADRADRRQRRTRRDARLGRGRGGSPRACPHPDPPGAGRLHARAAPAHRGGGLAAGDLDRRSRRRAARRPPRPANRPGPRRTPRRPPPVHPGRPARP